MRVPKWVSVTVRVISLWCWVVSARGVRRVDRASVAWLGASTGAGAICPRGVAALPLAGVRLAGWGAVSAVAGLGCVVSFRLWRWADDRSAIRRAVELGPASLSFAGAASESFAGQAGGEESGDGDEDGGDSAGGGVRGRPVRPGPVADTDGHGRTRTGTDGERIPGAIDVPGVDEDSRGCADGAGVRAGAAAYYAPEGGVDLWIDGKRVGRAMSVSFTRDSLAPLPGDGEPAVPGARALRDDDLRPLAGEVPPSEVRGDIPLDPPSKGDPLLRSWRSFGGHAGGSSPLSATVPWNLIEELRAPPEGPMEICLGGVWRTAAEWNARGVRFAPVDGDAMTCRAHGETPAAPFQREGTKRMFANILEGWLEGSGVPAKEIDECADKVARAAEAGRREFAAKLGCGVPAKDVDDCAERVSRASEAVAEGRLHGWRN